MLQFYFPHLFGHLFPQFTQAKGHLDQRIESPHILAHLAIAAFSTNIADAIVAAAIAPSLSISVAISTALATIIAAIDTKAQPASSAALATAVAATTSNSAHISADTPLTTIAATTITADPTIIIDIYISTNILPVSTITIATTIFKYPSASLTTSPTTTITISSALTLTTSSNAVAFLGASPVAALTIFYLMHLPKSYYTLLVVALPI